MDENNSHNFDNINRGDLIFTRSLDFTGKVIRFITRSEINHVAIYLGNGKIIESQLGHGVRNYDLQDYMNDEKCQVYYGSLKHISSKQIETAIKNAENLLKSPYDLAGQAGILFKIIIMGIGLGWLVKFYGKNITQNDNAYWCSELVAHCFEKAGVRFTQVDQRYATPEDFAISDLIDFKLLK